MKIVTGIASTTHIDRHFERFAKSALDSMAKQIKAKYIPNLIDHDPNRQNGIILYGEVFQLSDGEYGLGVVVGQFESLDERILTILEEYGIPRSAIKKLEGIISEDATEEMIFSMIREIVTLGLTPFNSYELESLRDLLEY